MSRIRNTPIRIMVFLIAPGPSGACRLANHSSVMQYEFKVCGLLFDVNMHKDEGP
jgi:hypothetical protein